MLVNLPKLTAWRTIRHSVTWLVMLIGLRKSKHPRPRVPGVFSMGRSCLSVRGFAFRPFAPQHRERGIRKLHSLGEGDALCLA